MGAASGAIIDSMWEIGKERNRMTFCSVAISRMEVAALVQEEMALRVFAHTQDPGDFLFLFLPVKEFFLVQNSVHKSLFYLIRWWIQPPTNLKKR